MLAQQYKNIIQWSLCELEESKSELDIQSTIRNLFDNLGIAFPQGDLKKVLEILQTNDYMGWRNCSCSEAQKFANIGIASIGISIEIIFLIMPDDAIENFSAEPKMLQIKNPAIKHTDELSEKEKTDYLYFSYNYGHVLN